MGDVFIIAIDFGTAYSGYAFSIKDREANIDPIVPQWGREHDLTTPKTPTCILFDENEEFLKFGYDAKMEYIKKGKEIAKKTLLFENFKMELHRNKLNEDFMITAINGKRMRALKVFTESLRYLKDHALNYITKNSSGRTFTASDFTWVLTVPAIWDASAKQFMRKAATEAGIVSNKLVIALEPEAASIWCKQLPSDGFIDENTTNATLQQSPGTQYIVVDCGGGTIDITVHEVLDGGVMKELHNASGNGLGGENVNKKFKCFLKEIFSDDLWNEYETTYPGELQKLMYNFSVLKCVDDDVEFSCPFNLAALAGKRQPMEDYFKTVQGVFWDEGLIKISKERLRSFFEDSLTGITKSINEILMNEYLAIEYVVLVGGYASSKILHKHITKQFGAQCKVLCPVSAQQAILKGAVMFGRNPAVVASRKSAFTYGIRVSEKFDASKHKADKLYTTVEGSWCSDVFKTLVTINEDVGWDETRDHIFTPIERNQTSAIFGFYRSERKNPQYVDEWGLEELNSFVIEMPDTTRGLDRKILFQVKFGFTEITATATDVDSKSTNSLKIDFLSK